MLAATDHRLPQAQRPIPVWIAGLVRDGWLAGRDAADMAAEAGIDLRGFVEIRAALGLPDRDHRRQIVAPTGDDR